MKLGICIPCTANHMRFLPTLLSQLERQTILPDIVSISISEMSKNISFTSDKFEIVVQTSLDRKNAAENRNTAANNIIDKVDIISFIDADDFCHPKRNEFIIKAFLMNSKAVVHNYVYSEKGPQNGFLESDMEEAKIYPNLIDKVGAIFPISEKMGVVKLHNGHLSILSNLFKTFQYNTDWKWATKEDSEYNNRIVENGIKLTYIKNELSNYIK